MRRCCRAPAFTVLNCTGGGCLSAWLAAPHTGSSRVWGNGGRITHAGASKEPWKVPRLSSTSLPTSSPVGPSCEPFLSRRSGVERTSSPCSDPLRVTCAL
jgi:hypothetical protein